MRRHNFQQEFSAASPFCGALVMGEDGGDTCGRLREDSIHEPRYDPYTTIHLTDPDAEPIPLRASLCQGCGVVVVDTAVHDRFHDTLEIR